MIYKIYLYDLFRGVPLHFYLMKRDRVKNIALEQNELDFSLGLPNSACIVLNADVTKLSLGHSPPL